MYVCVCNTVSDRRIREAVAAGATSFEALQATLGVSTCCGCCEPEVREMLETGSPDAPREAPAGGGSLHYRAA